MVAASFPNLSFENPPGTGPTLVSDVGPFVLAVLQTLEISVAGVSTLLVFIANDFADPAVASTDDVCAAVNARVPDVFASNDGERVRLVPRVLTGDDVTLHVVGGSANAALGFSTTPVVGTTYAGGPPQAWAVSESYSTTEWASFADENSRPEEVFTLSGWGTFTVGDDFEPGMFDLLLLPAPVDTFSGWSPSGFQTSMSAAAAVFGGVFTDETFNIGWGAPLYFAFLPVHLSVGISPEGFETAWGQSVSSFSGPAEFAAGTKTAEDFAGLVLTTHTFQPTSTTEGVWTVTIDNDQHQYASDPMDSIIDISAGLAAAITSGSTKASAAAAFGILSIAPLNPDHTLSVSASTPPGGSAELFLAADQPLLLDNWVGQDFNPDFE